jgi:hypothetical protein
MYTEKLGIPYINFYTQMPNERDYVISRIHKFMGCYQLKKGMQHCCACRGGSLTHQ